MGNQRQSVPSVQDLFAAAIDLAPEQRSPFLFGACAGAPAVRHQVEELLAQHDRMGSFLKSPLFAAADTTVASNDSTGSRTTGDTTTAEDPAPPRFGPLQVIAGRYTVVRFIDRGGMGEVYEVRDRLLRDKSVAMKVVRPEIAAAAESSQRFQQEVLLARELTHPNLCRIHDIASCDDPPPPFLFLTMQLLSGETLGARLKSASPLPPDEAVDICTQLIRGVGAMHAAGVIHRDLKPNNIILERSSDPHHPRLNIYIMDFGLARLRESEHSFAHTALAGTPGYIAPELLLTQRPTQATDLYALGIVLHQVLTGERPDEQQRALGVTPKPALRSAPVPAFLIQAVEGLLAHDPEPRCRAFDTIHAIADPHGPITVRSTPKVTRRHFLIGAGVSAAALATGAAFDRQHLYDWLHPLPQKRFVAVLNWPPTKDPRISPTISGLLDAVASELSRAEAEDHNFFVTTPLHTAVLNAPTDLLNASESLGTNLVLATSAAMAGNNRLHVLLRVLDPTTHRTLRGKDLYTALNQLFLLPQEAVHAAAELLDVTRYTPDDLRTTVGTDNHQAHEAFLAAELLRKKENDTGLDQAIDKYKEAIDLDPNYAKAQTGLAWAYLRSFGIHHDAPALTLARENSERAIALDPTLPDAHTALAWALEQAGDHDNAQKEVLNALRIDPSNPRTLNYQGRIYEGRGLFDKAEETYQRLILSRPNFWLGHEEYGALLQDRAKYADALTEYQLALRTDPKNALTHSNIGDLDLAIGNLEDALRQYQASSQLKPNAGAASGSAAVYRIRRDLPQAIGFALQAVKLDDSNPESWLALADCYNANRKTLAQALPAYRSAASAQEKILRTRPKYGPGWMILALCRAKSGDLQSAGQALQKADTLHDEDIGSQLYKVRTLELLGRRDDALKTIAQCIATGATPFQFQTMPDLDDLQKDPRFADLMGHAPSLPNTALQDRPQEIE